MSIEHLSPAQRELYEKAKAALNWERKIDGVSLVGRFCADASPAAVIDILTQLGEARAEAERLRYALAKVRAHTGLPPMPSKELALGLIASIECIADAALAARPATAEGTV